jgi:hypothetical protein
MALVIGSAAADTGMSKAIYDQVDVLLAPPLQHAVDAATGEAKAKAQEALDAARDGWKKLSFAISTGVVNHLLASLEVRGIQVQGNVNAAVSGSTSSVSPGPHQHTISLPATQNAVSFIQSNDGTGRVR